MNKEAAGDDLGLTLQTGYVTKAPVGLFGTDKFRLTVSADGSGFFEGLIVDNANGIVDQPRLPRFKGYTNSDNHVALDTSTKLAVNNTDTNDQDLRRQPVGGAIRPDRNPWGIQLGESSLIAGGHEQTVAPALQDQELPADNEALKRRGSLTIWFDPEMSWDATPTGRRGRQMVRLLHKAGYFVALCAWFLATAPAVTVFQGFAFFRGGMTARRHGQRRRVGLLRKSEVADCVDQSGGRRGSEKAGSEGAQAA